MKSLVLSAFVALLAAGCARNTMPVASSADAERASQVWPGTTEADLHQGRKLYIARCSGCHLPVAPASVAPGEWPGHVAEMQERANLVGDEATLVERYLVTMAAAKRGK